MFSSPINRLRDEVNALKSVLATSEHLRKLLFPVTLVPPPVNSTTTTTTTQPPILVVPPETVDPGLTRLDWQMFDHCAAFTRLYAIYEQFVTNLISDYLRE